MKTTGFARALSVLSAIFFIASITTGCSSPETTGAASATTPKSGGQSTAQRAASPLPPAAQAVMNDKTMPDQAKAMEMNRIMSQQNNK